MAATASLPSSSLSSSQSLNSSHSSEGSCSFVVVEKSSPLDEKVSQLNAEDKQEMKLNNESPVEAGSVFQEDLIQRVQGLTKENEELKGVLIQNNKLLEKYFQDLAGMQKNQKQAYETLCKGYDQAKEVVKKLQEKNQSLKAELKSEQIKNQQLEKQVKKFKGEKLSHSSSEVKPSTPKQFQSLNQEIKRLEGEKAMLEINNSKMQEHISCLRTSLHEAEKSTIEGDERETLVSMGSLIPSSDQTSMESMQSRYSKLEIDKEILLVNLQKLKIEKEQIQQQYENLEEEHKLLTKHLAELEQIKTLDNAAVVESGQVTELSCQLEKQTESERTLKEELDAVKEERDEFKKRVDELVDDLTKESAENEEIEQMKQLLQNYRDKGPMAQEAVEQHLSSQAKLRDEIGKLKQQMETEKSEFQKQLDDLMRERDTYKAKAEEMHTPTSEDKEKYGRVKKQLWKYQERDNYLQDKENALLAKEEACTQKLAELCVKEEALTQEKQRHEEEIKILKKQLGETHEQVLLLKEDLNTKSEAMAAVQTNEKCLREQLLKLQLENQNLSVECEKCRADCTKQEEETQSVKRHLSETHKALETSQTSEEHMKAQVTQLIQENDSLGIELERLKEDLQQQEEETQSVKRRNETHEQEYLLLKEQLLNKDSALETSKTSEEHLKEQVTQLIQEKQTLERLKGDLQQQYNVSIGDLQSKLEQSKAHTQKLLKQVKDLQWQLAEVRVKEEALTQEQQKHEQEIKILKKQLGEIHEHEVLLLKEDLHTKSEAMAAVQTNEKLLREQLSKLQLENQNLSVECEKRRADCTKLENLYQDSEHQRSKRDDIKKDLSTQLATTEKELHKSRAQIDESKVSDESGTLEMTPVSEIPLKKEHLDSNEFINKKGYPKWTQVTPVVQGGETPIFEQFFSGWRDEGEQVCLGKVFRQGALAKQSNEKFDASKLHDQQKPKTEILPDDGTGEVEIWRVEDRDLVPWEPNPHGVFFSGDSYVIKYSYTSYWRPRIIIYFWQGQKSSIEERAAATLADQMDKKLGGIATQVRVVQNKEPEHFLRMFRGRFIILEGGKGVGFQAGSENDTYDSEGKRMFHVRGSSDMNAKAIQVPRRAASLNSGDIFVLETIQIVYLWRGRDACAAEWRNARKFIDYLMVGREVEPVREGKEPVNFWKAIGGIEEYATGKKVEKEKPQYPPRLFQCSNASGAFKVEEIFEFSQEDLIEDDVMFLDTYDEVFVWIGEGANEVEKGEAFTVAMDYVRSDPTGRSLEDTMMIQVKQGYEPLNFTGHFHAWDRDKWRQRQMKRKWSMVKGMNHNNDNNELGFNEVDSGCFSYESLTQPHDLLPGGIDKTKRESYLSNEEFCSVFGMDRTEFQSLNRWKQDRLKKKTGLF